MRKILMLLVSSCMTMQAQVFQHVEIEKLSDTQPGDCRLAGISPDGSYVLTTTQTSKGLRRIDLKTGEATQLTDLPGAGFEPKISSDGRHIVCRKVTFDERHMRQTALQMLDIEQGTQRQMRAPVRNLGAYSAEEKAETNKGTEVFIEDMQLMVTIDGVTTNISPNGTDEDTRYIWPSLSPDGRRILYYVSGVGAYVCNLEGGDVQFIAHDCRAPQWYDNNIVIGMNDRDDGKLLQSSSIMAYSLDKGSAQELTDNQLMLMYPKCCAAKGIIVCSAASGEVFVVKVQ